MEFFLAGFNLEHCQVFWQLRWVYSQAMKRVYAGCSPRHKSISNDRTVRRHDVGEQSVKPKVLSGVFPVFPKHNHGITEGRDDNPIGPRHHEPWWHPRPNCAFCCTRIVPDKCSEVNIHVKSVLQAFHHGQCCVCPDPAVLVEEEHSYHVTLCLNAHQEFFAITLKTSVRLMALCKSSCFMLNVGLAALCDQRQVFCIGRALFTPWPHSVQIWRGTSGLCGSILGRIISSILFNIVGTENVRCGDHCD